MAVKQLNNLSMATSIKVKGSDYELKIDFSDKRMVNKMLHLMKTYENIEEEMNVQFAEAEKIEDTLDKLIFISDAEVAILTKFKNSINDLFNTDVVTPLFGDCLPDINRYYDLLEALRPYMEKAMEEQEKMNERITKQYGLDRIEAGDSECGTVC